MDATGVFTSTNHAYGSVEVTSLPSLYKATSRPYVLIFPLFGRPTKLGLFMALLYFWPSNFV